MRLLRRITTYLMFMAGLTGLRDGVGAPLIPLAKGTSAPTIQPVPEHAPVSAVVLSEELFNYEYRAAELAAAIIAADADVWIATPVARSAQSLRRRLKNLGLSDAALRRISVLHLPHDNIWLRDFGPQPFTIKTDRHVSYGLASFRYDGNSTANEKVSKQLAKRLKVGNTPIPVYLDGGNFLVAGDVCLSTTGPADAPEFEPGPRALAALHAGALGCRKTVILEDPPHAHLDMWAKVLDDRRILVNEIDEETLLLARELGDPAPIQALQASLNRMAAELSKHLEVHRVPMPLPYRGVFRTYANAILVNGYAIVPSYARLGWNYDDYPDARLKSYYERKAIGAYEAAGYKVRLIAADGMIYNGGAFHCVTINLPRLPKKH